VIYLNPERIAFIRSLTSRSFYHFVKIFGSYNRQGGDISPITHRQICDFVSDYKLKRKGVGMPRNTRKTTLCDRWLPLWRYLHDHNYTGMMGAETKDIATLSIKWIKAQVSGHEFLRAVYPELQQIDKRYINTHTFSDEELVLPREASGSTAPTFMCIGVGGAAQGRHVRGLYLTDIIGDKAMTSQTTMMDTLLWCESLQELLDEPNPKNPNGSEINLDFTYWAVGDVYMQLQEKYDWEWRIVPALKADEQLIKESTRDKSNIVYIQHPTQAVGETNFPDVVDEDTGLQRFSTEHYHKLMQENERVFWTQHMNMPWHQASSSNTFRYSWLRWYHIERDELGPQFICEDGETYRLKDLQVYAAIDPGGFASSGLKNTQSKCAFVIAAQAVRSKRKFILYTLTRRIMEPKTFVQLLIEPYKLFKPQAILIETIAAQEYIYKDLYDKAVALDCKLPLRRAKKDATSLQEDAKNRRISSLKMDFSDGNVYLMKNMLDFISEFTSHPGLSNDLLDALSLIDQHFWTNTVKQDVRDINAENQAMWDSRRNT